MNTDAVQPELPGDAKLVHAVAAVLVDESQEDCAARACLTATRHFSPSDFRHALRLGGR